MKTSITALAAEARTLYISHAQAGKSHRAAKDATFKALNLVHSTPVVERALARMVPVTVAECGRI